MAKRDSFPCCRMRMNLAKWIGEFFKMILSARVKTVKWKWFIPEWNWNESWLPKEAEWKSQNEFIFILQNENESREMNIIHSRMKLKWILIVGGAKMKIVEWKWIHSGIFIFILRMKMKYVWNEFPVAGNENISVGIGFLCQWKPSHSVS